MGKRLILFSFIIVFLAYFIVYLQDSTILNQLFHLSKDFSSYSSDDISNILEYIKYNINVFTYINSVPELASILIPIISIFGAMVYKDEIDKGIRFRIGKTNDFFRKKNYAKLTISFKIALFNVLPIMFTLIIIYLYNPTLSIPNEVGLSTISTYAPESSLITGNSFVFLIYMILINFFLYSFICTIFLCTLSDYMKNLFHIIISIIIIAFFIPFILGYIGLYSSLWFLPSAAFVWERDFFKGILILNIFKPYFLFIIIGVYLKVVKDYEI